MKDEYTSALYDVVKETSATRGFDLPEPIEAYVVMLLSSYVDKPDFLPENGFGQMFFSLKTSDEAKKLGDTCLFVSGVFPALGERKGINRRYYQDIGSSSYEMVAEVQHYELFNTLATHFEFLSNFIEITVNSANYEQTKFYR
jgi:hypothetical protein